MVGRLQGAGMVMDEKLDMIIEHLRKQEEKAERLELRLAEYSESMAEVRKQSNHHSSLRRALRLPTLMNVCRMCSC